MNVLIGFVMSVCCMAFGCADIQQQSQWQIGPFQRIDDANPILVPNRDSTFHCPLQDKVIQWEGAHVFNPGAVVRNGKVYLFYRAEDDYGTGIGNHTSRIGLAISEDGVHFERVGYPVLYPDHDEQSLYEFPGGCEDPRIVEVEDGSYVMTYTQWNRQVPKLGIATSNDLISWKKQGRAFGSASSRSKSGSIVCRYENDRLIATKIQGKYWMYWGEGMLHVATSDDLIAWRILRDADGVPVCIAEPRAGKFDSLLVEPGPQAILTDDGIVLLYNGKNSILRGDPLVAPHAYCAGQLLFDSNDPTRVVQRCENYFLKPEKNFEMNGQYTSGTVFIQGCVRFKNSWFLY